MPSNENNEPKHVTQVTIHRIAEEFDEVYRDVEDPDDFELPDEDDQESFLLWGRSAYAGAFDDKGILRCALPIRWGGTRADVQMIFAQEGLTVRIDPDEKDWGPCYQFGWLIVSPRSAEVDSDLLRLLRAFADLWQRGIVALPNAGATHSEGSSTLLDTLHEEGNPDGTGVFWDAQDQDAFDSCGKLTEPLYLGWRGDVKAIVEGLREHGFTVKEPPHTKERIVITKAPVSPATPEIESVREAIAATKQGR